MLQEITSKNGTIKPSQAQPVRAEATAK